MGAKRILCEIDDAVLEAEVGARADQARCRWGVAAEAARAGVVAVIVVGLTTVTLVAAVPPKVTAVAPVK